VCPGGFPQANYDLVAAIGAFYARDHCAVDVEKRGNRSKVALACRGGHCPEPKVETLGSLDDGSRATERGGEGSVGHDGIGETVRACIRLWIRPRRGS
jgi:hypothetical protein